jgi:hypothetical protein
VYGFFDCFFGLCSVPNTTGVSDLAHRFRAVLKLKTCNWKGALTFECIVKAANFGPHRNLRPFFSFKKGLQSSKLTEKSREKIVENLSICEHCPVPFLYIIRSMNVWIVEH